MPYKLPFLPERQPSAGIEAQQECNLMMAVSGTSLDPPLRLLVWEDEKGQVYLSYRYPNDLKQNFELSNQQDVLDKMGKVFERLSEVVR